jgi:hypothetical protein
VNRLADNIEKDLEERKKSRKSKNTGNSINYNAPRYTGAFAFLGSINGAGSI